VHPLLAQTPPRTPALELLLYGDPQPSTGLSRSRVSLGHGAHRCLSTQRQVSSGVGTASSPASLASMAVIASEPIM